MTAVMDAALESRRTRPSGLAAPASPLSDRVIVEFSAAEDFGSGMERAVQLLRRAGGVNRVEWWAAGANAAAPRLEAADGPGGGRRESVQIGDAGTLFVEGDWWSGELAAAVMRLAPIVRRRCAEERLAVRRPDRAAERGAGGLRRGGGTRAEGTAQRGASRGQCRGRGALGPRARRLPARGRPQRVGCGDVFAGLRLPVRGTHGHPSRPGSSRDRRPRRRFPSSGRGTPPRSPESGLQRGLRRRHADRSAHDRLVGARTSSWSRTTGSVSTDRRLPLTRPGSGLGLGLSKRIVARFGGTLELEPRVAGGARAVLEIPRRRP